MRQIFWRSVGGLRVALRCVMLCVSTLRMEMAGDGGGTGGTAEGAADATAVEQLRDALRDDLDTPRALRILDAWAERVRSGLAAGPRQTGTLAAEDVAAEWDVEPQLLHRWVRDFLVAGTAVVTNRPDPDEAHQRDRFLAAFAHELRTPVSVATGWAMVLAEGDVPPEQVPDSLDRLADNLGKLSRHIADNLAVLNKGKIVDYGPTDSVLENPEHEYTRSLIADVPKF